VALKRQRLCQRRKTLGFSQERLAGLLGVERSTVVRWENAETDPQPWHRTRIAEALGVTLDQLDAMLSDVSVATRRGRTMGDDVQNYAISAARPELLTELRAFLTSYLPAPPAQSLQSPADLRRQVSRVHTLYQRASYRATARLLPDLLHQVTHLASTGPAVPRPAAFRLLAAAYVAASKLAVKVGDGPTALLAADRASTAARCANDRALGAIAAYQAACALRRTPGRAHEAEQVTTATLEQLSRAGRTDEPDLLSAHGSLLLLAAVIAAGSGQGREAARHLAAAQTLADELGADGNRLWTGFGPTNVLIHTVSAAVRAGDVRRAIEVGEGIDTSRLPAALVGRRAQVHLDLATATAVDAANGSLAVLHLLEAERVAPETVHSNVQARTLLQRLLARERRSATPGLRPLAERAGLLA
jgi:transcriptional regulator with XRE-family HTH domain